MTRLAAAAAASIAGGAGLEAAEKAIRAGLLRLGASVLEELLAADAGYAGPRVPCGEGHEAPLVSCRARNVDTVLGPVTIRRAWYHCYAQYRALGLFVGSGVVEAGCKSVIGQRLKLSGMRWTEHGATGILTLRCQESSGRWHQTWTQPGHPHAA